MAAGEAVALLEALRGQVAEVAAHGREMLRRVRAGRLQTRQGVSLLHLRCQALLWYLQDLTLLLSPKIRGGTLGGSGGALERLLETRVVLEKLRPLELGLKYQLEKLLRAAARGGRGPDDPLSFRPAPSNMAAQEEEEEPEGGGGAKAPGLGGGRGRYRPPRLVPVSCAPPEPSVSSSEAWARRRALSGSVLRELRDELSEAPPELGPALGGPPSKEELHRLHFEESTLRRLRAGPGRGRAGPGGRGLDSITHFGAFPALLGANQEGAEPPKKRKRKTKVPKKKGRRGERLPV
ncbi:neuroguidin-like [Manacus candei]|uniref:neuroguidin-like n=1 Tax=Manacus candei TaxID=415023 RepID=UPI002225CEE9|nr:neuroguidin-like [Manacus candei]